MTSLNGNSVDDFKALQITQIYDDYEEDDEDCEPVVLGFVESLTFSWSNLRQLFPNLAGGLPAWLDPINLPSGKSILCDICEEPMHLVLQLYAPIKNKESAYHRTLFLFMCPSMSCLLRDQREQWKRSPGKAMRSEDPKDDGTDKPMGHGAPLCTWCGTWKGDKVCTGCKNARYCSPKHQCQELRVTMESSDAALVGNGVALTQKQKVASKSLWKEFELVGVDESEYDTKTSKDHEIAKALVSKREVDDEMRSLMIDFEGGADQKSWVSFKQRIAKARGQVLRYSLSSGGKPLWPLASGRVSKSEIPNCKSCGGPLCFEFQVMPQLLYFFGAKNDRESLDWATIVVYTCKNSCESSLSYKEEFVWVQLYPQTT